MKNLINVFLILGLVTVSLHANAQKIKFKKGNILIDEEIKFTYKKGQSMQQISIYNMTGDELIFIKRNDNETPKYFDDDFVQITFINQNRKLESVFMGKFTYKRLFKHLIENEVIDLNGVISEEKLNLYFTKFDEQITERTIR